MNTGFTPGINQTIQIAQQQLQAGNIEYASQILEKLLATNPDNVDAIHLMSMIEYMRGNMEKAIDHCNHVLEIAPDSVPVLNNLGNFLKACDDLHQAKEIYQRVLKLDPACFPAQYNLGNVEAALGFPEEALNAYKKAIVLNDSYADCHYNMGMELSRLENHEEALKAYSRAVELDPSHGDALTQKGTSLYRLGRLEEAVLAYENAADAVPGPSVHNNLGVVLTSLGRSQDAVVALNKAVQEAPDELDFRSNLGTAQIAAGDLDGALMSLRQVLKKDSNCLEARKNLGLLYYLKGDTKTAENQLRMCLEIDPNNYEVIINLASCVYEGLREEEAEQLFETASYLKPESLVPQFGKMILSLKHFSSTQEEFDGQVGKYTGLLESVESTVESDFFEDWKDAEDAISFSAPFTNILHDINWKDLQVRYSRVLERVLEQRYPEFIRSNQTQSGYPTKNAKIKLGVVSHFFSNHSVYKMVTKGWVAGFDRAVFELIGFNTSKKHDFLTQEIKGQFDKFVEISDFSTMAKAIFDESVDVLLYPSIGMVPVTQKLAALRLAPLQLAGWGHPLTAGLKNIDYRFVSDLFEPEDAQDHYSEQLIRLPGLGSYYDPVVPEPVFEDFSSFGLKDDSCKYLCVQTLHKYPPSYDNLLTEIAKQKPDAQFIFARKDTLVGEQLKSRLYRKFESENLDPDKHIVFLPELNAAKYQGLCQRADVYLDTPVNSGLLSSIEALEAGIPAVTLCGQFMRGRQTATLLEILGVEELVANSPDEYIQLAVSIGSNEKRREEIKEKILACKERFYRDQSVQEKLNASVLELLEEKFGNRQ